MTSTTDPNVLAPLTQLANQALQEQIRRIPEFATSSRWGASAIVLQLNQGPAGYEVRVGFELRTPLDDPIHDTVLRLEGSKEAAVRQTVAEWLSLLFKPAMAIHSNSDAGARLGETVKSEQNRVYSWRMAEGPLLVSTESKDEGDEVKKELTARSIFDRLDFAKILPIEREVPLLCLKMQLTRSEAGGDAGPVTYECRINNNEWPAGLEVLKRFHLPKGRRAMRVTQYCLFRRTGKGAIKPTVAAAPAPVKSAGKSPATASQKKPWWKVW